MGTPDSYRAGSTVGAQSAYTDFGPPEKMMPLGRRARSSAAGVSKRTISE